MKTRITTAVIALAIFIPLIIYGHWPLTIAAVALGMVAMSEVLVMKKMFVISFEALISYLGVALLILPDSWLDFSYFTSITYGYSKTTLYFRRRRGFNISNALYWNGISLFYCCSGNQFSNAIIWNANRLDYR